MLKYRVLAFTNLHIEYYGTISMDGILVGEFDTWEAAHDASKAYSEDKSTGTIWVHIAQVWK